MIPGQMPNLFVRPDHALVQKDHFLGNLAGQRQVMSHTEHGDALTIQS